MSSQGKKKNVVKEEKMSATEKKEEKKRVLLVKSATIFCPGIDLNTTEGNEMFGPDFLQLLRQYNDLKKQDYSKKADWFIHLLDCDGKVELPEDEAIEIKIFYLLNYLEFLLNCFRQLIINSQNPNDGVKEIIDKIGDIIVRLHKLEGEVKGCRASGKGLTVDQHQNYFRYLICKSHNFESLTHRLDINFAALLEDYQEYQEYHTNIPKHASSGKAVKEVAHDYKQIRSGNGSNMVSAEVVAGTKNPSGLSEYRLEWLLKTFMNRSIELWCEENNGKINEYIRKLNARTANQAASLAFLTKLMILLLQDINRVSYDRLLNNKILTGLFARASLCSLLVEPKFDEEGNNVRPAPFREALDDPTTRQKKHIKRLENGSGKGFKAGLKQFENFASHLRDELIFSPLDYYIAIIESQERGEERKGGVRGDPESIFQQHLKDFRDFVRREKSFCYGSSYTKMFSLKSDQGLHGTRGEFEFGPLWKDGGKPREELEGGLDWAQVVGLSLDGNLYIIKPGEQTKTGSTRMRYIAPILTQQLGYNSALLCLGLTDIGGGLVYKAATENEFNEAAVVERMGFQVESIKQWKENVGEACNLIMLLLPPVPWQDPREVFNGLWGLAQMSSQLTTIKVVPFLHRSDQVIRVCENIADRTYYNRYREMWRAKQQELQNFALWCLNDVGDNLLQTCRAYNLQNIHYDYHLLRNLYFTHGELLWVNEERVTGIEDIEDKLGGAYLHVIPGQLETIRRLSLHKFAGSTQKKYWVLDAVAQIFKQRITQGAGLKGAAIAVTLMEIAEILGVDQNLAKKEDDSGMYRLLGNKLHHVHAQEVRESGFKTLTAKKSIAKGRLQQRMAEVSKAEAEDNEGPLNTFKFLENMMKQILKYGPRKKEEDGRLLNYDRTAVVLLLDNLVGFSFFGDWTPKSVFKEFMKGQFNWWNNIHIGSRLFNRQFIFDYCIGTILTGDGVLKRKVLSKPAEDLLHLCLEYKDVEGVTLGSRYLSLMPPGEPKGVPLRSMSGDPEDAQFAVKRKKSSNMKKKEAIMRTRPEARQQAAEEDKKKSAPPDHLTTKSDQDDLNEKQPTQLKHDVPEFVPAAATTTIPSFQEHSSLNTETKGHYPEDDEWQQQQQYHQYQQQQLYLHQQQQWQFQQALNNIYQSYNWIPPHNYFGGDALPSGYPLPNPNMWNEVIQLRHRFGYTGGKRTRKRRKSKKPRKTKSKRFRKKKKHTRKKRYKKKRRKTRR